MWSLFCHYLILIFPSFGAPGGLCVMLVAFPEYLYLNFRIKLIGFVSANPLKWNSFLYNWLSLSRHRLYRITAYLEVKILSLLKHENLTRGEKKYCGKEENLLLRSNFSSFLQYFQYISNFKSPITYIFVKCGCSNYFFLNSANLICRGTDISKLDSWS